VRRGRHRLVRRIRYRRHDESVFLYAFDLIELDGEDLRRDPLAVRKAMLASALALAAPGRLNEHMDHEDGALDDLHQLLGDVSLIIVRHHRRISAALIISPAGEALRTTCAFR
jgi:ATP-dependent DNA ligase